MSPLPFSATTPIHIARVGLRARDAEALARFYREVIGLEELGREGNTIRLGAAGRELLSIEAAPDAKPDDPRGAGLFHTAFLLPSRADLARWLRMAAEKRLPLDGASDHLVSEAVYLDDPEGNGIEIYADRDEAEWPRDANGIAMATLRLDIDGLIGSLPAGDAGWQGAPENTVVGHVHLRVGDPREAERWWKDQLGFSTMARYGDAAVFLADGGYHHHIGANVWRSKGAGPRDPGRAGLGFVELAARNAAGEKVLHDPWGTEVRVVPASA